jgi:lipooligosaccharide transport system permease protein
MSAGVPARDFLVLPLPGMGGRHLIARNVLVYRRTFLVIFSGFFEPLFYLLGIGFGLGALIGTVTGPDGAPISYQLFVAPALMATSAMNGAIYDSTINVFFKLNFQRTYDGVLATPLGVVDVAVGEIAWALIRGTLYAVGFIMVMVALGLVASPLAILAVPAAMLIGFAFAAVGMAATTFMRKIQDFDLLNLVQVPLFLFSATFFPLSTYPPALQTIVQLTPLYHGIALIRELTLGAVGSGTLVHVVYLVVMGLIGLAICQRRLGYLLRK